MALSQEKDITPKQTILYFFFWQCTAKQNYGKYSVRTETEILDRKTCKNDMHSAFECQVTIVAQYKMMCVECMLDVVFIISNALLKKWIKKIEWIKEWRVKMNSSKRTCERHLRGLVFQDQSQSWKWEKSGREKEKKRGRRRWLASFNLRLYVILWWWLTRVEFQLFFSFCHSSSVNVNV